MTLQETFLIVPGLSYQIYLGQTFLRRKGVCCLTPEFIYFDPTDMGPEKVALTREGSSYSYLVMVIGYD